MAPSLARAGPPWALSHMTETENTLGLIAGNRTLPLLFAQQARKMGINTIQVIYQNSDHADAYAKELPDAVSIILREQA